MITLVTSAGTTINMMMPDGTSLQMKPAEGKSISPNDLIELAAYLKRDPLRCYVAVDTFVEVLAQQLFTRVAAPAAPAAEEPKNDA